ncbi:MAG: PEP-CTERM sorting domain-containing protein [bacterium]
MAPNPLANYATGINNGTPNYSMAGVPGIGIQIDGIASVPEPSTHALLGLGGLMLVVAHCRRRA